MQCAVTEEKTLTAESSAALPAAGENVLDITGSFTAGSTVLAAGQASGHAHHFIEKAFSRLA